VDCPIAGTTNFLEIMAKTNAGRKIVSVPGYTKNTGGKTIKVRPHKRSTPN
jgi:hypothetical protein